MADDETLEHDPQEFDCSTCVIQARIEALDTDNRAAWQLHRRLCNRFLNDLQAGHVLLARLTEDLDSEAFADQCERLRVIHDVMQPLKERP